RVFARHPETTFVALHVANHPEDLDSVSAVLDRYPNVLTETGARHAELGRQPRRARAFFLAYQDRILFGTDYAPSEGMDRNWFRFLETADEAFDYWNSPGQGRWTISGLDLPAEVLEKVYRTNAERLFAGFKGLPPAAGTARQDRQAEGRGRRLGGRADLEAAPEVPRRDRAVGTPGLGRAAPPVGSGEPPLPPRLLQGLAHAVVVHGEDVHPAEPEDEVHLGRPPADALHLREHLDDRLVVEPREPGERQPVGRLPREVAHVADLLAREADAP